MSSYRLPPQTHIGLAHLRVSDLDRALSFYRDRVGFREARRNGATAVLSASGGAPAHLVLEALPGARPRPPRTTGLYHVAIRLPTRAALAQVVRRLAGGGWPFQGAADHGVSEAFYLADPDGNGLELYVDRPREQWAWSGDQVAMVTEPLDVEGLLAEAGEADDGLLDPGADIGHVHLSVSNLAQAEAFYADLLGLDVTQRTYPGALFLAAGGYHHHLGTNTWAGSGAIPPPPDAVGLAAFELRLPDRAAWEALVERVRAAGYTPDPAPFYGVTDAVLLHDPDQIGVLITASAG
jgi:catechol 2,3-dioxygenase